MGKRKKQKFGASPAKTEKTQRRRVVVGLHTHTQKKQKRKNIPNRKNILLEDVGLAKTVKTFEKSSGGWWWALKSEHYMMKRPKQKSRQAELLTRSVGRCPGTLSELLISFEVSHPFHIHRSHQFYSFINQTRSFPSMYLLQCVSLLFRASLPRRSAYPVSLMAIDDLVLIGTGLILDCVGTPPPYQSCLLWSHLSVT